MPKNDSSNRFCRHLSSDTSLRGHISSIYHLTSWAILPGSFPFIYRIGHQLKSSIKDLIDNFKNARAGGGGQTRDLLVLVTLFSHKQNFRYLSYCAPIFWLFLLSVCFPARIVAGTPFGFQASHLFWALIFTMPLFFKICGFMAKLIVR